MNRRTILTSGLSTAALLAVPPVVAQFIDTESAEQGTIEGDVLDLKLSEEGPATRGGTTDELQENEVTRTLRDTDHGRLFSSTPAGNTLRIDNTASTVDCDEIGVAVSYVENDGRFGRGGNANLTVRSMRVSEFTYGGRNLLGSVIADENGNGRYDVEDLTLGSTREGLKSLAGIEAGESTDLRIEINGNRGIFGRVRPDDGIEITVSVVGSAQSFEDQDVSVENTIQYR